MRWNTSKKEREDHGQKGRQPRPGPKADRRVHVEPAVFSDLQLTVLQGSFLPASPTSDSLRTGRLGRIFFRPLSSHFKSCYAVAVVFGGLSVVVNIWGGGAGQGGPLVSGQSPTHSPIWIIDHPQPHHHHLSTSSTSTYTIRRRRLSSYRGGAEGGAESHAHAVVGGAESHALW